MLVMSSFPDIIFLSFQISLREGCKKILVSDSFGLIEKLIKIQKRGIAVEGMFKDYFN